METENPLGWEEAEQAKQRNTSPRWRRLEDLERWVAGVQYSGRKNWFDDSVPLWEREPCIVTPIVNSAIQSNVDLLLGEGRFPQFSSKPGEDEGDDENGLDEDDSADLDRFIAEYQKISQYRAHAREAFSSAQGCGTAVAINGVRNGKPFNELVPAKWCTPTFDDDGVITELELKYPYLEEYQQPDGKWAVRAKLYRRIITDRTDTTFLPADARADGIQPNWQVDPARSFAHSLGFCPVIWYAHMKGCGTVNQIDGHAIHELIRDEIQAHDIARSQWHRCSLLSEPQICETGVSPGTNPTAVGRPAIVPATLNGGPADPISNPINGSWSMDQPNTGSRKKGPGHVWQYSDKDTKVFAVTIGVDALKAQQDNCSDLRVKLQEAMCVVFLDPENIKFAATTSGKALEAIKQRQIDRCNQYRDDFGDRFLLPSVDMQLRIAHKVGAKLRVPGLKKAFPLLKRFAGEAGAPDVASAESQG